MICWKKYLPKPQYKFIKTTVLENIKGVSQLKCLETVHKSGLKKVANQIWYQKMAIAFKLTKNPSQNMLECLYGAETII